MRPSSTSIQACSRLAKRNRSVALERVEVVDHVGRRVVVVRDTDSRTRACSCPSRPRTGSRTRGDGVVSMRMAASPFRRAARLPSCDATEPRVAAIDQGARPYRARGASTHRTCGAPSLVAGRRVPGSNATVAVEPTRSDHRVPRRRLAVRARRRAGAARRAAGSRGRRRRRGLRRARRRRRRTPSRRSSSPTSACRRTSRTRASRRRSSCASATRAPASSCSRSTTSPSTRSRCFAKAPRATRTC